MSSPLSDTQLLDLYVNDRSNAAFEQLVTRYVSLVYSVSLRQAGGDSHLAEDISQKVFTALAQNAEGIKKMQSLSSWLYSTACYSARSAVRSEKRREERERKAMEYSEILEETSDEVEWSKVRPVIDDLLEELDPADRDAICMRFFESLSFSKIGERIELSENSARMKVVRALDKLKVKLGERGVKTKSLAIAMALSGQIATAAPEGLAKTILKESIGLPLGSVLVSRIIDVFNTKNIVVGTSALVVSLSAVAAFQQMEQANRIERDNSVLSQRVADLSEEVKSLRLSLESALDRASEVNGGNVSASLDTENEETAYINRKLVEERYEKAVALDEAGQYVEALEEYMWCYNIGMVAIPSMGPVRNSGLVSSIYKLGDKGTDARTRLREIREAAASRILNAKELDNDIPTVTSIDRVFGESGRSLELYDAISHTDLARSFSRYVFGLLAEHGRYDEAAQIRDVYSMKSLFEIRMNIDTRDTDDPEAVREQMVASALDKAGLEIEVLVGTRQYEHAIDFASLILSYDNSDFTQNMLREHFARAGSEEMYSLVLENK